MDQIGIGIDIPEDTSQQRFDESPNTDVDPVVEHQSLRDVVHNTVTDQNPDVKPESHTADDHLQFDPTKSPSNHEDTINMPFT